MKALTKIRLNLVINEAVRDALSRLQQQTGAVSKTEVVRMALGVYERLAADASEGWTTLQRKGDVERQIIIANGTGRELGKPTDQKGSR